jgi:hypothetical protein
LGRTRGPDPRRPVRGPPEPIGWQRPWPPQPVCRRPSLEGTPRHASRSPMLNPACALIPLPSPSPLNATVWCARRPNLRRQPSNDSAQGSIDWTSYDRRKLRDVEPSPRRIFSSRTSHRSAALAGRLSHHRWLLLRRCSLDLGRLTSSLPVVSISLSSPSSPLPLVPSNRSPSCPGAIDWIEQTAGRHLHCLLLSKIRLLPFVSHAGEHTIAIPSISSLRFASHSSP